MLDASDNKLATIDDVQAVLEHNMLSSLQLEDNACSMVKCWRIKLLHYMLVYDDSVGRCRYFRG